MTAPGGDDIGEKIARLLSSPDGMEKIQTVMAALGGGESSPPPPAPTPLSASPASPTGAASSPDSGGMPDIAALSRMLPLLQAQGLFGSGSGTREGRESHGG